MMTGEPLKPHLPSLTATRFQVLMEKLGERVSEGLIVAFSGGVDSAFLTWAAASAERTRGGRVLALTAVSESMSEADRSDARRWTEGLGVTHLWETSLETSNPAYVRNDGERCYHCKTELFRIAGDLRSQSRFEGKYRWVAYGYNASDAGDLRPGHRAALENGVISPLADAGMTKEDIRIVMRAYALDLAEKPASPCLSSRLMTGVEVTPEKLADVEALEALLRSGGLKVFRVRLHEWPAQSAKLLRLEVDPVEMPRALELREGFGAEALRRGYRWVTLDLGGYRMGGGTLGR